MCTTVRRWHFLLSWGAGTPYLRAGHLTAIEPMHSADSVRPPTSSSAGPAGEVTRLVRAWISGERGALDRLLPHVYDELRQLARGQLAREHEGHTLDSRSLVHEAYPRLAAAHPSGTASRACLFGIAAGAMRAVLVDHARAPGGEAWPRRRSPPVGSRSTGVRGARRAPDCSRRSVEAPPTSQSRRVPHGGVPLLRGTDHRRDRYCARRVFGHGATPLGVRKGVAAPRAPCG